MARNAPAPVQQYRGTTAQHAVYKGLDGEITVDTTKKTVVVHDGVTAGGHPLAKEATTITASNGVVISAGGTLGQNTTVSGVSASTSVPGVVQLNNAVDSTSQTQAATPKAVSDALAEAKTYAESVIGAPNVANATGILPVVNGGTGLTSLDSFVRTTGDQTISGVKTFTSDIVIESVNPDVINKITSLERGVVPNVTIPSSVTFSDKNDKVVGQIITLVEPTGLCNTGLVACNQKSTDNSDFAKLGVGYNENGTKFGFCPTPPAEDNGNRIATTEWVRTFANSNQVVNGTKTFTSDVVLSSTNPDVLLKIINAERGVVPSELQIGSYTFLDKNNHILGQMYTSFAPDGIIATHIAAHNPSSIIDSDGAEIGVGYTNTGVKYSWGPIPPVGDKSAKLATTGWVWLTASHAAAPSLKYIDFSGPQNETVKSYTPPADGYIQITGNTSATATAPAIAADNGLIRRTEFYPGGAQNVSFLMPCAANVPVGYFCAGFANFTVCRFVYSIGNAPA